MSSTASAKSCAQKSEPHPDDAKTPEEIRDALGVSQKAFKQAIGALYRERRITMEPTRI